MSTPPKKKSKSNLVWPSVAVSVCAISLGLSISDSSKEKIKSFIGQNSVLASASVNSDNVGAIASLPESQAKLASNTDNVKRASIKDLPTNWPNEIREYVSQFYHPAGEYWRSQVMAHEDQERTPGWVKFESYSVEKNRDVLALPTFVQMRDSKREDATLVVRLVEGADAEAVLSDEAFSYVDNLGKGRVAQGLHLYVIPEGADFIEALEIANAHPSVIYAEANFISDPVLIPDDPGTGSGLAGAWWLDQINASEAWDISTDGTAIGPVAVIDDGVRYTHEDLAANAWVNPGEIAGNGLDDDGNGYVDDINGIVIKNGTMNHGAPVAGTICGQGDNAIGYTGSSWDCQILQTRILFGTSGVDDFIEGLNYAVAAGARISNNSWGGSFYSTSLADAITAAGDAGHLFVASAGNSYNDSDVSPLYPAAYPNDNIISVAAADSSENKWSYSNYGLVSVDLAAPSGFNTVSNSSDTAYAQFGGTSQAGPVVAGAAALAWSQDTALTHLEMKQLILDNVRPVAVWSGLTVTGGILDMEALMLSINPDTDGDGLLDDVDPDDDNDGVLDGDDAFPRDPSEWLDSDGDGVGDNSDVYPSDPSESADSDGDGVGDNADAFPNDASETVDSDGDGVGDNSDVYPSDPAEWADTDGDGIGDNSDIDNDNDAIENGAENALSTEIEVLSPVVQILLTAGNASQNIDLSSLGTSVGQQVRLLSVVARGDLGAGGAEYFNLDVNLGEYISGNLTTSVECGATLVPVNPDVSEIVTVIDLGGGVPGIIVSATASSQVNNICSGISLALEYQFTVQNEVDVDVDQDGINNLLDLDSDNDGIADIVEVGVNDVDADGRVDNLADQGSINVAPDTDGDGIPDHLDLESSNPLNDGTAFDIRIAGFGFLDTNGDGMISALDAAGGVDSDNNGIDDSLLGAIPQPDADLDGFPDSIDAFPSDPSEWLDTDGDGVGDNADVFPSDPTESGDVDGDGVGDNTDIDNDNDGLANDAESPSFVDISSWPVLGIGIASNENSLLFDDQGSSFPRQANSDLFSALGYSDAYRVSWNLTTLSTEYGVAIGLGSDESGAALSDVDYAFWTNNGWYGLFENGASLGVWAPFVSGETVFSMEIDAGQLRYLVDGVVVRTLSISVDADLYVDALFDVGSVNVTGIRIEPLGGLVGGSDLDGDGVHNALDLDSDNDSIPDVIEAGLSDADGNFIVDTLTDQGSITSAPDDDFDGIPNHLDLESLNPANDGTEFDILVGNYYVLDSNSDGRIDAADIGGGNDVNGNGVDDLIEAVDTDGDLYPDVIDPFPNDPTEWSDVDGDGVGDNSDVFPSDPTESADSDGDGVGDNADAFPNDPSESVDTDGDGVGDNSDTYPSDPSESIDSDGDGVGDNADIDDDNDGLADAAESYTSGLSNDYTPAPVVISSTGGTLLQLIDLAPLGSVIGDRVTVSSVVARGDLGDLSESFTLDINAGQFVSGDLTTGIECGTVLVPVTSPVSAIVSVVDIGGGTPGIQVVAEASVQVNSGLCSSLSAALEYQLTISDGVVSTASLDSFTSSPRQIVVTGGFDNDSIDLSGFAQVGESIEVSSILARGDLDAPSENFYVDINSGELISYALTTRFQCESSLEPTINFAPQFVTVVDIGAGVPGINIFVDTSAGVNNICSPGNFALEYQLVLSAYDVDFDSDGLKNRFDLDSDNDSIPDIMEVGLIDSNGDFIVDDLADQGIVGVPIDTDSDGIPDFLDLESSNPLNDGTAFDIATRGFVSFDTNADGVLNGLDVGGGIDANNNGVDDLAELPDADGDRFPDSVDAFPSDNSEWFDSDGDGLGDNADVFPNDPTETDDSDGDGVGDNADAFPNDPSETLDSDGDGIGDNADAFPNDPSETVDGDGDGIGDNSDIDFDNDGLANSAESGSSVDISNWPVLEAGILSVDSSLLFDDGVSAPPLQANSDLLSILGFTDEYSVSWILTSQASDYGAAIGLGENESSSSRSDIEFAFWTNNGWYCIMESGVSRGNWAPFVSGATVFSIEVDTGQLRYMVDGNIVYTTILSVNPDLYVDANFYAGQVTVSNFTIEALGGGLAGEVDADGDGVDNMFDLDSDNDSIPDLVEMGLADIDGNFIIDNLAEQGSITTALDSDGDLLPDHLDLESHNPLNDGTAFDLWSGVNPGLDTNGDGQINADDVGGGIDANNDGVDDLIVL